MVESLGALDTAVRSGRALYAGISAYDAKQTAEAVKILRALGTPCLIHQPKYSMFVRDPEQGLLDALGKEGVGTIVFSPLAQGLLSDRYLAGIPSDSRAARDFFLKKKTSAKINSPGFALSTKSHHGADRVSPRWRLPGCCAIRASPVLWSGPVRSRKWMTTSRL